MKPLAKWHWGYLPIVLLLAVVWHEFWKSFNVAPIPVPPPPAPLALQVTVPPSEPSPLPPISLKVTNASLSEVVNALNKALGGDELVSATAAVSNQTFTLDITDRPFWEVFRELTAQRPTSFAPFSYRLTLHQETDPAVRDDPRTAFTSRSPVRDFQISGPAILCVTALRGSIGSTPDRGNYNIGLLAAVDPRLAVIGFQPLKYHEAMDDTGQPLNFIQIQSPPSSFNVPTNYMFQNLKWQNVDPAAKSVSLKCDLHFSVQLPGGDSSATATIDDAAGKVGSLITVGERRIRLARFSAIDATLQVQFASEVPSPSNPALSFTVTDSAGRTVLNAVNRPLEAFTSGWLSGATGPFRLELRCLDHVQDYNLPFDLRNIPLP